MKVNQTTNICPRLKPVQLPLVGKWVSINSATRIFCRKAMLTGISSVRSWVIVMCSLIPRAYLNSYFLAKIRTNCEYRSKYNPIERCWGILELKWNGAKLIDVDTMLGWAKEMTWKGLHPVVELSRKVYEKGISLRKMALEAVEARWKRDPPLPQY